MTKQKCVFEKKIGKNKIFAFEIDGHIEIFENGLFYASVDTPEEMKEEIDYYEMAQGFIEQMEKELKKGKRKK